ncbi:S41 family peptidase [Massilia sp. TS11]|uniref:S41 family peptidase n=1 Tax=Massilia sp. TS11 TaxID=2908003 RepID=UPI001EDC7772|nr:S41 family peptidase [Massilia sp. TS11]MCG2586341.1 S41 family peptidase [Massilia sp. TS11]
MRKLLFCMALILALPAFATSDEILDAAARTKAIQYSADMYDKLFYEPAIGKKIAALLRSRLREGAYDQITSARDLAEHVNADIHSLTTDHHTGLRFFDDDQGDAVSPDTPPQAPDQVRMAAQASRQLESLKKQNFYFRKQERLPGNIAFIEFDGFAPLDFARDTAIKWMNQAADADALIFDLRENGGGNSALGTLLASYLFEERVLLDTSYDRKDNTRIENWTDPAVPGPRFGSKKPVFILTSKETFSAAERFIYVLKARNRVTVIGEKTAGGAHRGYGTNVSHHLVNMLAIGHSVTPGFEKDWEGVGITPDIEVAPTQALDKALTLARTK